MTLPASFPLSMSQVASEVGLSLPVSFNHQFLLALAGNKVALPVSMSDFLSKSGHVNANGTVQQKGTFDYVVDLTGSYFFSRQGGYISTLEESNSSPNLTVYSTDLVPDWQGNIIVTNTSLSRSLVLGYNGGSSGAWGGASHGGAGGIGIFGNAGATYNLTIYPHT